MKKRLLTILTAAVMLAAVMGLSSCGEKTNFDELDEDGFTVSVTFDAADATIKGSDSTIYDVFNPDSYTADANGNVQISLLPPDSPKRDKNNILTFSKPDHFLAGWYSERTPIDENDLSKGYTYSGKWDFDKDTVTVNVNETYHSADSVLTLYAAWIPYYSFEIYSVTDAGEELLTTQRAITLDIPSWKAGDVTIDMGNFPKRGGYTLDCVYSDAECTTPITAESFSGSYNVATGTSLTPTIKLYTTWLEGTRYRIYTADDLRKNADKDGQYDIYADLDFSSTSWPAIFLSGEFNGTINGRGHKISGIKITTDGPKQNSGIFASISENARFKDITFENATHTFNTGRVPSGASVGLLAGSIAEGAVFEGVSVSGKLIFGDLCYMLEGKDFTIGLIAAGAAELGISESVSCEKANPQNTKFSIEVIEGEVKLIFTE